MRLAKTDRGLAMGFCAENNLKEHSIAIRWRAVDLRHGIINRAGGVIESVLDDKISRDEVTVIQLNDLQHIWIEGQMRLEGDEIGDILNFHRDQRRIIDLK